MGTKPKAGSPKKKAKPKAKDEKQFERFVETARSLGVDESGKEFERAFTTVSKKARQS